MTSHPVECLRCGAAHVLVRAAGSRLDHVECPLCGYVGWAPMQPLGQRALLEQALPPRLRLV